MLANTDGLIGLLIQLVIVGVVLYIANLLINRIPMDATIKQIINIVLIVIAVIFVLQALLAVF